MAEPFLLAQGTEPILFNPRMGNRHGLIAGATGTGKTVTLQALAESFSSIGVPVFMSDIKGDLSGIAKPGTATPKITERLKQLGLSDRPFTGFPVTFWDILGKSGHPVRATISEMGPLLLARVLNLNDTQEGVLQVLFRVADEGGLLLLDLDDLREMLRFIGENAQQLTLKYGNVSAASVGTIQRALLQLDQQGGAHFFGEPSLNLDDFLQTAPDGRGVINILAADQLMTSPRTYSTALLWLLSELFERLPEVGDLDKPKLVFFFDEAHLLFTDLPQEIEDKIEHVVRLIRSKGVGIYFVTQNPLDVPEKVLGQLGNRVQHALRAFTPRDQKAVQSAAETFRQNPKLDVAETITQLAVGEALVSLLDDTGTPAIVQRASVVPPRSQIGPITADERAAIIKDSVLYGTYETSQNRESAAGDAPRPHHAKSASERADTRGHNASTCHNFIGSDARSRGQRRRLHLRQRSALRHHRSARRTLSRTRGKNGVECRAQHGLERRPRNHPRRARFIFRQQPPLIRRDVFPTTRDR